MADIADYFANYLPNKLMNNPNLAQEINAVYVFDIEGAGSWTVDLPNSSVRAGRHENPDCVVSANAADFEVVLDQPGTAEMFLLMGKLKGTRVALLLQLQKLLS